MPFSSFPSPWIRPWQSGREVKVYHLSYRQIMLAASPTCGAPLPSNGGRRAGTR
jgi:hypothetical protein